MEEACTTSYLNAFFTDIQRKCMTVCKRIRTDHLLCFACVKTFRVHTQELCITEAPHQGSACNSVLNVLQVKYTVAQT